MANWADATGPDQKFATVEGSVRHYLSGGQHSEWIEGIVRANPLQSTAEFERAIDEAIAVVGSALAPDWEERLARLRASLRDMYGGQ